MWLNHRAGRFPIVAVLAAGAFTAGLSGCGGGGAFETQAVYVGSESGFQVTIDAKGTVAKGRDISTDATGVARVAFLGQDNAELLLVFSSSDDVQYEVANGEAGRALWPLVGSEKLLDSLFERANLSRNEAEIADLVRAIDGALTGPEGTLRQGQAGALDVMRVASN